MNIMTKEEAKKLIEIYGRAWETKDPNLIISIFTQDATYNDPHEPINEGREAIRKYWISKVVGEQDNIHFSLRNLWLDGETVIAEWDATFTDIKRNLQIEMTEVAIFGIREGKFFSIREYYKTIRTPL